MPVDHENELAAAVDSLNGSTREIVLGPGKRVAIGGIAGAIACFVGYPVASLVEIGFLFLEAPDLKDPWIFIVRFWGFVGAGAIWCWLSNGSKSPQELLTQGIAAPAIISAMMAANAPVLPSKGVPTRSQATAPVENQESSSLFSINFLSSAHANTVIINNIYDGGKNTKSSKSISNEPTTSQLAQSFTWGTFLGSKREPNGQVSPSRCIQYRRDGPRFTYVIRIGEAICDGNFNVLFTLSELENGQAYGYAHGRPIGVPAGGQIVVRISGEDVLATYEYSGNESATFTGRIP